MAEYSLGNIIVLVLGAASLVVILATTVYACWQCQSCGGNIIEDEDRGDKAAPSLSAMPAGGRRYTAL